jgi:hypothetical protein
MTTNTETRKAALLARTSTSTLLASFMTLDAMTDSTPEQGLTRVWILEELERRVDPLTTDEDVAFCEALDANGGSYIAALLALRPQLANL